MPTILVPFHDDDLSESALAMANALLGGQPGFIEGLFVLRPPQIFASEGIAIPGGYITELAEEERALADRARTRFQAACERLSLADSTVDAPPDSTGVAWHEAEGLEPLIVGERGRLFDTVVVGRTAQHLAADWNATCEAALFDCGRPVLVAPAAVSDSFGKHIVIAWNCSTETARTVSHGRHLLAAAEQVTVLTVTGLTVPGPSGEDLARHLRRCGIRAAARTVDRADLLFKGAYTNTRLRQLIFGGATRHILSEAKLPVYMAH